MAVIVELDMATDAFDLGRVTDAAPGVHLELERVVPTGGSVMPFFWASGVDFDRFERAVRSDELVRALAAVTRVEDRVLYHVEWSDTVASLAEVLDRSGATILEATGDDSWIFRLRFFDHSGLRDFHNLCREAEIEFQIERIYTLDEEYDDARRLNVTAEQQEALVTAVERGYFEVPRGTTLSEVAAELDISQQAASERVRRGADSVLRSTLLSRSASDLE
jgi:predicted DNA binding protein